MFDFFFKLRQILSLKTVSVLNWKKHCQTQNWKIVRGHYFASLILEINFWTKEAEALCREQGTKGGSQYFPALAIF